MKHLKMFRLIWIRSLCTLTVCSLFLEIQGSLRLLPDLKSSVLWFQGTSVVNVPTTLFPSGPPNSEHSCLGKRRIFYPCDLLPCHFVNVFIFQMFLLRSEARSPRVVLNIYLSSCCSLYIASHLPLDPLLGVRVQWH